MSRKNRTVLVTPRGRAIFPYLNTPDTKFNAEGRYKVDLAVPAAIAEDLVAKIDDAHREAVEKARQENPKSKRIKEADLPYEEDHERDEVVFKFRMKASFRNKAGETVTMRPALFDAKGKPLPPDVKIGGGSILRVSFEPAPYYTALNGAGVTLRLKAVQVIELQTYGGASASAFGFEAEDGYEADSSSSGFDDADEGESVGEEMAPADDTSDGSDF